MSVDCVGFADCPCRKCRRTRVTATAAHLNHERGTDPYCGACRTAELQKYRVAGR